MNKAALREKFKEKLLHLKPSARRAKSAEILRRLKAHPRFQRARRIFIYLSLPQEVDTKAVVRWALKQGKAVYAPKVEPRGRKIRIYRIQDPLRDLRKGAYNIREPVPARCPRGRAGEMDLLVVPGVAFDRRGCRLGRGGGYFDRFLKRAKGIFKIGLAFREQVVNRVPAERHDVKVNQVIHD